MCNGFRNLELKAAGGQGDSDEYPTHVGRMGPVIKPLGRNHPRQTPAQRRAGRRKIRDYMRANNLGPGDMGPSYGFR